MTRRRLWIVLPLVGFVVAFAGLLKWHGLPWLGQQREIVAASPSVGPFAGALPLELKHKGDTLCNNGVTFSPDTQQMRIPTLPAGQAGPSLKVTATAPGYHVVRRVSGWPDGQDMRVDLPTPAKPVIGNVCIEMLRKHQRVRFLGGEEPRIYARPELVLNGKGSNAEVMMTFYQHDLERFSDRLPAMLAHISALSWPAAWLLWILVALVIAGVPAGAFAALWLALRDDADAPTAAR